MVLFARFGKLKDSLEKINTFLVKNKVTLDVQFLIIYTKH